MHDLPFVHSICRQELLSVVQAKVIDRDQCIALPSPHPGTMKLFGGTAGTVPHLPAGATLKRSLFFGCFRPRRFLIESSGSRVCLQFCVAGDRSAAEQPKS
jgi:hypothetical protein